MKPVCLFIAGTDTGIGKTHVAAALLGRLGAGARYLKPVQTGCATGEEDGALIARCCPGAVVHTLYRFREPLSPLHAARREGRRLDPEALLGHCRKHLELEAPLVAEAAGGLFVPITESYFMIDLAHDLGIPLVLVARSGLGTLNHTLLSVEALSRRGLAPRGIILNPGPGAVIDELARENRAFLSRHTGLTVELWEGKDGGGMLDALTR